jgi:DNA processing protein
MIPEVGPMRLRKLLEVFGSAHRILLSKANELRAVDGIGGEVADSIAHWEERVDLGGELKRIQEFGARVVTQIDPEYPRMLREIHNPPIVLYVWGELKDRDVHAIGVVGSRAASHYGLQSAKKLSYQLAYAGVTVVSGLARGIDSAAHQAALAAKGRTIAVIGSGLNKLYPPENAGLAELIAASGAVVSEYPMDRSADRQTFPYRNRIVAGWGSGVLVIEAALNSGALITAGQALEHGRSVYAVPGPIDRPTSTGSNRLIQQGAKLVMDAGDILDEMHLLFPRTCAGPARTSPLAHSAPAQGVLSEEERKVYDAIDDEETPIDSIIGKSGLPTGKVSSTLLALEMKHLVRQLPGQHFVKLI